MKNQGFTTKKPMFRACLVFILLTFTMFVPLFTVADETNTAEPYLYLRPPGKTFGMNEPIKTINNSYFWSLMSQKVKWRLEGQHPTTHEWIIDNDAMQVEIDQFDSYQKVTLNFTSPFTTHYRFTFGIELDAIEYFNRSTYEIVANISVPDSDEFYTVVYNWSDLKPLIESNKITISHGRKNVNDQKWFWFRINTVNEIPIGTNFIIDPYFGQDSGSNRFTFTNDITGSYYTLSENGTGVNITGRFYIPSPSNNYVKCALYYWSNKTLVTNGVTEEKIVTSAGASWVVFNFTTPPTLSPDNYLITTWTNSTSLQVYYQPGSKTIYQDYKVYNGFSDPFVTSNTLLSRNITLYCSYNAGNDAPVVSSPSPSNGANDVLTTLSQVSVTINDPDGDTFNWSIETKPDIGDDSATGESNGSKTCSVSGLLNSTTYTWYVNVTDGNKTTNETFTFTTVGNGTFYCYDESQPWVAIPFGMEVSNQEGTVVYQNNSIDPGDTISIGELPTGDDIVFVINSTGYEPRVYVLDIVSYVGYNLSFYLPPEQGDSYLHTSSINYSGSGNITIGLDCSPSSVVSVQAWNNSGYGYWYEVPNSNYSLSGASCEIDGDYLDSNTIIVKASYYCSYDEYGELYVLNVYAPKGEYGDDPPIEDATIQVRRYMNTTGAFENVSILLTDGNGQADCYLVPEVSYHFVVVCEGYDTEYAVRLPLSDSLVFRLVPENATNQTNPSYDDFFTDITITGTLYDNDTMYVTYYDANSSTINTNIVIYEFYNGTLTYVTEDSKVGNNDYSVWLSMSNASRDHQIRLFFNTTANYNLQIPMVIVVYGVNKSYYADAFDINARFEAVFGDFPPGYDNTICIAIALFFLIIIGVLNTAFGILACGFSVVFTQALYGIYTTNFDPSFIVLGVLIIFLGVLVFIISKPQEQMI